MTLHDSLSEREKEVAEYLRQGLSNKQIAQALGISTRTVEFHLSHIYEKLGAASRAEAAARLTEAHLRETAGGPVGADLGQTAGSLRGPTVEKTREPSENDGNFIVSIRRITMKKILLALAVILLAVPCLALAAILIYNYSPVRQGVGQPGAQPTYTPWHTPTPGAQPTYTPWHTPTPAAPTYTPIQPTPTRAAVVIQLVEGRYTFEGLSFRLDPAVAGGAGGWVIAETDPANIVTLWDAQPRHLRVRLDSYPLAETEFQPVIAMYPVEDYRRINEQASRAIDLLADLLARQPAEVEKVPFLPGMSHGVVFHTGLKYLDFQSGHGLRYLGIIAGDPAPVTSQNLFYTYQGLTADGRYIVSVVMPVSHPILRDNFDAYSIDELIAIAGDYDNYRALTAAELTAQPSGTFTPDLYALDALAGSIEVKE